MSESPTTPRRGRIRRAHINQHEAIERGSNSARVQVPEDQAVVGEPAPPLLSQPAFQDLDPGTDGRANGHEPITVPFEAQFAGKDYLPAPGLRRVGSSLIERYAFLRHVRDVRIEYVWKRRGGTRRGVPTIGDCVMPGGLARHAWNAMARAVTGSSQETVIYVVWLAADHLENFTPLQVEAALMRQLLKTGVNPRDASAFTIRGPDFVGFRKEIELYGLWSAELVQAAPLFSSAARSESQNGSDAGDPWGADAAMETTLLHEPVETTGEGSS